MSDDRMAHLVERAVERMRGLGAATIDVPVRVPPRPATPAEPVPARQDAAGSDALPARETPAAEPVAIRALEAAGLMVAGPRRSQIAEEWSVTAGRLMRAAREISRNGVGQQADNLLLVTSAKPNEGKSFSALNLSASIAMGRTAKVLLVDLDSKPGALTGALGLTDRPGLFDFAADSKLRPEDLVIATAVPGLAFLPIGRAARLGPASVDRTITRTVVAAIEQVARRFPNHVVVLDSAPCLATSDASTLAGYVGQIAMIVEAGRTQRSELEAALELLRPCANIVLVLNKAQLTGASAFGDYNYYG